jgi:hypothetical protein
VKYIFFGYSNLMAIHADARQWSRLNLVKRYLQRDKIKNAISIHQQNLTDCLHTFQVSVYSIRASTLHANALTVIVKIVTLMTVSNPPDRVETMVFPGLPVSARPVAASENTVVSDLWRATPVLLDTNRLDF